MKKRQRNYYSAAQQAAIWDRWQRGESMSSIRRLFHGHSVRNAASEVDSLIGFMFDISERKRIEQELVKMH
ncbi:hypothetical protein [Sphingomonas sp. CARO-RG-8B-R24-01]|uniref:hypothetical protein n=1 Tax=Sphingomonas sp. CARO-RG-8B-R24-01 TaxID=2914831 RepID=UPI001F578E91|nr:hypothetical protein [Sphingomonas sp. CARO-RG-8B-R24-01]